ncbi:Hpt domain-containing protein [Horticoccus sp. 23ND18S-11]|uniref:Hpt domain-containing protein n=1 Tax=Horticoccus sp. 23ND18S-11 TaxID=3391832 RepID=UPI0039C976B9
MPTPTTPNRALADLATMLGDDNVRTLVRTFLRDFPLGLKDLSGGERRNRHRVAHSMKSSSRLMGAQALSQRMADIEARLAEESGGDVTADEIASIARDYETIAAPLRAFAGEDADASQLSTRPA